MQITKSDYTIAWLTLLSGLTISGVAVYYSVAGLMSIFAASATAIMLMGIFLESSKLVATVWLKRFWKIAPWYIRIYLSISILILMMITSMGIYGYLAKAHMSNNAASGDVVAKVAIIDEKLRTQQENILVARKTLTQLDAAVDQTMERSTNAQGATNAVYIRRAQTKERNLLQNEIAVAQTEISKLTAEKEPYAKEIRVVEAEVGPLKYIAALLYGDNVDNNMLERAVRWVIIMIVVVFDPLALVLLLTSQYTFQHIAENKNKQKVYEEVVSNKNIVPLIEDDFDNKYEPRQETPVFVPETSTIVPEIEHKQVVSDEVIEQQPTQVITPEFHTFTPVAIEEVVEAVDFQEFMESANELTLEIDDAVNTHESVGSDVSLIGEVQEPTIDQSEDDAIPDTLVEDALLQVENDALVIVPEDTQMLESFPVEEEIINTDSAVSGWSVEPKKRRGVHSNRGVRSRK